MTISTNADPIQIGYPNDPGLSLHLALGICHVRIVPGDGEAWVTGTFRDGAGPVLYNVSQEKGLLRLCDGSGPDIVAIVQGHHPVLDLVLGRSRAFGLTVELAGGDLDLELGGLPLNQLVVKQGAGRADVVFSDPNPVSMTSFLYSNGAGTAGFRGLGNANCASFTIDGGAVSYRCDFAGALPPDATVRINTGASSLDLAIPPTTPAEVVAHSLIGVAKGGTDWTSRDGLLVNTAQRDNAASRLHIYATAEVEPIQVHTS
jgi:hypothetical protein